MVTNLYPEIVINRIKKPSRFYAVPVLGFLIKLLFIIPVGIEVFFLSLARFIFSIINSFSIFFTGNYWKTAYALNLGLMRLETNISYYIWGITDTYPGFVLDTTNYELTLSYNKNPNRFLATPILGMLIRFVLMIPYTIYQSVVKTAAFLAVLVSWIWVLFQGKYPEATYEVVRDSVRVEQAVTAYFLGMSDQYPSFWISMRHKTIKIILLVLAVIFTFWSFVGRWGYPNQQRSLRQMQYPRYLHTAQRPSVTY